MKIDWTNPEEIEAIRKMKMAVQHDIDGISSPSLFIIGRDGPEDLIQPNESFDGVFFKLVIRLVQKEKPAVDMLISGIGAEGVGAAKPSYREIAEAICQWHQVSTGKGTSDAPFAEIYDEWPPDVPGVLVLLCKPLL